MSRKSRTPGQPSTSRERIIPITIEGEDDENNEETQKTTPRRRSTRLNYREEKNNSTEELNRTVDTDPPVERILPMYNVKEKIILVVDIAEDENFTPFRLKNAQQGKPLDMLRRAIEIFLHSKQSIHKKHEYALAVMNENSVVWLVDFTHNIGEVLKTLQEVNSCEAEDIFELNSLFDVILENVKLPNLNEVDGTILPPPYVVRTILLYGRSYTMPKLTASDEINCLLKSPYFTLDVLMTHEPVDDDNNCNKIFGVLQNLDQKGFAYFFPVGRDLKSLFISMGKLLSHPLQRPIQKLANYSIM